MTTLSSVVGKVLTLTTQNQRNLRGSRVICPRKLSSGSFLQHDPARDARRAVQYPVGNLVPYPPGAQRLNADDHLVPHDGPVPDAGPTRPGVLVGMDQPY